MPNFGLIGKNISYSFSKTHFTAKFENDELDYSYENFDIQDVSQFPSILKNNPNLLGLNVTIPYKESIIPYLDELNDVAKEIGAVNTIKIDSSGKLKGYNTDCYGFEKSLQPLINHHHRKALILGTGGASKGVAYALKQLKIPFDFVSRNANSETKFTYKDLNEDIIKSHQIIINCTPVGTHPNVNECPDIPYDAVTKEHILYDLIYNPIQTKFLICGEIKGATITNGFKMLELQADKAWEIWSMA
ncbi:shikimate dehydrogenase [Subsaxibacter sp. CAU 1640]|uniref:shikimate dehydrogenase family protein n=1 Tax=Subsaxibacter sp. CAU 1640 TaxID=2933271 RepID=UPI0020034A19|nr:shikimate dehydrogenase [Subsaxibacter sp. CAU 1640]MCK7591734.1 shikimate dehydrogenase [Subsaxibacter sp. CAU 1640]